jgi:hypothetical protein
MFQGNDDIEEAVVSRKTGTDLQELGDSYI